MKLKKQFTFVCRLSRGCLSNTTKGRVNAFLSTYFLQIKQKNYKYFCNNQEIKLDTVYFIDKNDNDGKYYINEGCSV